MMMIIVVMVVVTVAWIRDGSWGTTVESDMAVHPIDVDIRSRHTFFLGRSLWCWLRRAIFVQAVRVVMRKISPCQKRRQVFGS